jgi:hypothetical protein
VGDRDVKRAHRSNGLPKSDAKRLAKLMSDPDAAAEIEAHGDSDWVDFIDRLALHLGLVKYDIKGEYAGYSSQEPSFPENYIQFQEEKYAKFLASSPLDQERQLLQALVGRYHYDSNEFYAKSVLGRLYGFSTRGCATGIMPSLKFGSARDFLLNLLTRCPAGVWYSTESLVAYVGKHHPYFLIPEKPGLDQYKRPTTRYGNFYEAERPRSYDQESLADDAAHGFERVEGRYIERFLEGIPLTLRYLDVAYACGKYEGLYPERNRLQAFRIRERFSRVMRGQVSPTKVTVQPNFEIQVEGEIYPAQVLSTLHPFTTTVSEDRVTVLKLDKKRVSAAVAADDSLDLAGLLKRLTRRDLPQNVAAELTEWEGHSEAFTLFSGFALLEGGKDVPQAEHVTVECISPALRIVRAPETLYESLHRADLVPLRIKHRANGLARLPDSAQSVFPKPPGKKTATQKKAKERLTLLRQVSVTLHLPNDGAFKTFQAELRAKRCLFEADPKNRTVSFSQANQALVDEALQAFKKSYAIDIKDLGTE